MAQALAVPGLERHGFSFVSFSTYTFGRISAISATPRGNVIICDHLLKTMVLVDRNGQYLSHIPTDHKPWDVCVDNGGIAYVTFPFDDDKLEMYCADILLKAGVTSPLPYPPNKRPLGISYNKVLGIPLVTVMDDCWRTASEIRETEPRAKIEIGNRRDVVVCLKGYRSKLHFKERFANLASTDRRFMGYHITSNNNLVNIDVYEGILYTVLDRKGLNQDNTLNLNNQRTISIPTLQGPSDVCSDDNGHVYIAGQYSHNIHRVTEDGDVVDIPLSEQHGLKYPVAICFNKEFTRFYVANDWGRSLLVFDVVSKKEERKGAFN